VVGRLDCRRPEPVTVGSVLEVPTLEHERVDRRQPIEVEQLGVVGDDREPTLVAFE